MAFSFWKLEALCRRILLIYYFCASGNSILLMIRQELEGLVSREHGIGFAKKSYMLEQCGCEHVGLMKNIKFAFDPKNILNTGKVCQ